VAWININGVEFDGPGESFLVGEALWESCASAGIEKLSPTTQIGENPPIRFFFISSLGKTEAVRTVIYGRTTFTPLILASPTSGRAGEAAASTAGSGTLDLMPCPSTTA
jgi:hypothetical protein